MSFLRGFSNLLNIAPRIDFVPLTAEQISAKAWQMTGDRIAQAMNQFDKELNQELKAAADLMRKSAK